MIHISVDNSNEQTALQIRDFLIEVCGKEDVEFSVKSYLTFIDTYSKKVNSYVHKTLNEDFSSEIVVLEIYESQLENKVKARKLTIDINLINSYWGS